MRNLTSLKSNKKGTGLVTGLIFGIIGLVIGVIIGYVVLDTVIGAGLLGAGDYNESVVGLSGNLTEGVGDVATKLPTILTIAAVVLLFGVLVILVARARQTNMTNSGGSL